MPPSDGLPPVYPPDDDRCRVAAPVVDPASTGGSPAVAGLRPSQVVGDRRPESAPGLELGVVADAVEHDEARAVDALDQHVGGPAQVVLGPDDHGRRTGDLAEAADDVVVVQLVRQRGEHLGVDGAERVDHRLAAWGLSRGGPSASSRPLIISATTAGMPTRRPWSASCSVEARSISATVAAAVSTASSDATRSGRSSVRSSATSPPSEWPRTWARLDLERVEQLDEVGAEPAAGVAAGRSP